MIIFLTPKLQKWYSSSFFRVFMKFFSFSKVDLLGKTCFCELFSFIQVSMSWEVFQFENPLEVEKLKTTTCSVASWLRESSGRSSRNFITFPPCVRKLCPFDRRRTRTPVSYSGFDSSLGSFAYTHISNHQQWWIKSHGNVYGSRVVLLNLGNERRLPTHLELFGEAQDNHWKDANCEQRANERGNERVRGSGTRR